MFKPILLIAGLGFVGQGTLAASEPAAPAPTMADVLASAPDSDWRPLDPGNTLYLELDAGRVVIELAPDFAPRHVDNVRRLARGHYWDGLAILRSQDNYVVQWGDPQAGRDTARSLGRARSALPAEFTVDADALAFTALADGDVYAAQVGWTDGFPSARDASSERTWLAHCYGAVGAGRDNAADSSNGSELYVVTGHSPRHLDRNITLIGRVVQGIELLSVLPRGTGALGFYESEAERVPIRTIRLATEVPEAQRTSLEVMRTDSRSFARLIDARRNRRESWFIEPVGKVELCNVPIPVRAVGTGQR